MNVYRQQTGSTFPLALNGATATGGNVELTVGTYDNYLVVNKQGIVRYHAALTWPHGNRYHLGEIRNAIDSLVTPVLDVPGRDPAGVALSAGPNPSRGELRVTLSLPSALAGVRVQVLDVSGRLVATLAEGALGTGSHTFSWSGPRTGRAAGLYLVRAAWDGGSLVRRVVVVR